MAIFEMVNFEIHSLVRRPAERPTPRANPQLLPMARWLCHV